MASTPSLVCGIAQLASAGNEIHASPRCSTIVALALQTRPCKGLAFPPGCHQSEGLFVALSHNSSRRLDSEGEGIFAAPVMAICRAVWLHFSPRNPHGDPFETYSCLLQMSGTHMKSYKHAKTSKLADKRSARGSTEHSIVGQTDQLCCHWRAELLR